MAETIKADYLLVGAGAMGMAFADALLAESDRTIAIVDGNVKPGGHWTKTYPYVRLHQPAAYYGVNSTALDHETVDKDGWNEGLSTLATGQEICSYYDKLMQEKFLASGRVQYFPKHVSPGDRSFKSLETGKTYEVGEETIIVDGTYSKTTIPSSRPPPYDVADGVDAVPPNSLPERFQSGKYSNYTVVGSGKTGVDAVLWLLGNSVSTDAITWIMPRDAYYFDRGAFQPMPEALPERQEKFGLIRESIMDTSSVDDYYRYCVEKGLFFQFDEAIKPTMHHCATVSKTEFEALKKLKHIIRKGRVTKITDDEVTLENGTLPAKPGTLYIDCSANSIKKRPLIPIFQEKKITLQPVRFCQQTFSSALIGHVEATYSSLSHKNSLTLPVAMPDCPEDYLLITLQSNRNSVEWFKNPKTLAWVGDSRLNIFKGVIPAPEDPNEFGAFVEKMIAGTEEMSAKVCGLLMETEHREVAVEMKKKLIGGKEENL